MYSLPRYRISLCLSVFYIFIRPALSSSSLHIDNCSTVLGTNLADTIYSVKIDAEIIWKAYNVGSIKKMKFLVLEFEHNVVNNFTVDITSMKTVHVQRLIQYKNRGFEDIAKPYCSLSFIYDYNRSLKIPHGLEDEIILHAENCVEKVLCNFNPEDHKIGDDIHVIATTRHEKLGTTSQTTINSIVDLIVDIFQNRILVETNSLIYIPKIEISAYTIKFSSSGGILDILRYIKLDGDLSFQYEGHCYIADIALHSTGGHAELNDVSLSSVLGNFLKGQLPVNTTGATLHMKIMLDYNKTPCKISVTNVVVTVPSKQFDFSSLKIKALGFVVTNADTVLSTLFLKTLTVSSINRTLAGLIKNILEGLKCEDYRGLLFGAKKNV